jgi:hypothetical protein
MVQAAGRRPLTPEARVRSQTSNVRFVVEKVALGQVFIRLPVFPCQHHSTYLHVALTRRTNGRSLRIFLNAMLLRKSWSFGKKSSYKSTSFYMVFTLYKVSAHI